MLLLLLEMVQILLVVMLLVVVVIVHAHVAGDGGHVHSGGRVRGVAHGRRRLWEGRGDVIEVAAAELGDDGVGARRAYIDWCEGGDGLESGGDLLAPVGGLLGQRQVAKANTRDESGLEDEVAGKKC